MEVKMTTGRVLDASGALQGLAREAKFSTRTAYKLAVLQRVLDEHLTTYHEQVREMVKKYKATPSPMGGQLQFPTPEAQQLFEDERGEMNKEELIVRAQTIPLQRLAGEKITHTILAALMPFLVEWDGVDGRDELAMRALAPYLGEDVKPKQVIRVLTPFLLEVAPEESGEDDS